MEDLTDDTEEQKIKVSEQYEIQFTLYFVVYDEFQRVMAKVYRKLFSPRDSYTGHFEQREGKYVIFIPMNKDGQFYTEALGYEICHILSHQAGDDELDPDKKDGRAIDVVYRILKEKEEEEGIYEMER